VTIEAIFVVMGKPDTAVQQCPLAMDKWIALLVSHRQIVLGLIINTRTLTVGIPKKYCAEAYAILNDTWHF